MTDVMTLQVPMVSTLHDRMLKCRGNQKWTEWFEQIVKTYEAK